MVPGGHHSSVAEHWQLKPEALCSIPSGATFHFVPCNTISVSKVHGQWLPRLCLDWTIWVLHYQKAGW